MRLQCFCFVLMLPVFAHPLAAGPGKRRPEEAGELYPQSPPGPESSQGIKSIYKNLGKD